MILTRADRVGTVDIVVSASAVVLGIPGCIGPALGLAPGDWPIPFGLHLLGDFALRSAVYLSGFSFAFGAIGIIAILFGRESTRGSDVSRLPSAPTSVAHGLFSAPATAPPSIVRTERPAGGEGRVQESQARGEDPTDANDLSSADIAEGPVPLAEPLYGFLPGTVQQRLSRETHYQALLYTKVSILLSAIVGVLLAGSWEIAGEMDPLPPDAVLRIAVGLYLVAESAHRYIQYARGRPTGTLIGTILYGALAPLRRRS